MSRLGLPRVHQRTVDSTNERAKALAREGAPHGTLVTADEQTAGRGRQGRTWAARPGTAVLMSLIVRDLDERHALLPLSTAVAVCDAAEACAPVSCSIKWPNDVWIDGRKLAGILVEGRPQAGWAVIGVGINVTAAIEDFPQELRETATSLAIETPASGRVSREAVLSSMLDALASRYRQSAPETLAEWRGRDALRGSRIAWDGGTGTAAGVDGSGALVVDTEGGRVTLDAGEVHLQSAVGGHSGEDV
jgi:BirA family biotin operon repressor/biotin-[acetyl-CoA-carboxylase] ligase